MPRCYASLHQRAYKTVDLKSALYTAWDLGVVVLPLRDRGAFHGACWRYEGRNAIVLKQTSSTRPGGYSISCTSSSMPASVPRPIHWKS